MVFDGNPASTLAWHRVSSESRLRNGSGREPPERRYPYQPNKPNRRDDPPGSARRRVLETHRHVVCPFRHHNRDEPLRPGDIDWDTIFGTEGSRWFHTGGIFAALSAQTPDVVIEAITAAKRHGTVVSYDLNYRPSLWESHGGQAKAIEVNRAIAPMVDVMIGNEEDFSAALGFEVETVPEQAEPDGSFKAVRYRIANPEVVDRPVVHFSGSLVADADPRLPHVEHRRVLVPVPRPDRRGLERRPDGVRAALHGRRH